MTAHARFTHTDRDGNVGMIESLGSYPTVEEAQNAALAHGAAKAGDYRNLYWRQFSETTWGLMSGERYTHVSVALIVPQEKAS